MTTGSHECCGIPSQYVRKKKKTPTRHVRPANTKKNTQDRLSPNPVIYPCTPYLYNGFVHCRVRTGNAISNHKPNKQTCGGGGLENKPLTAPESVLHPTTYGLAQHETRRPRPGQKEREDEVILVYVYTHIHTRLLPHTRLLAAEGFCCTTRRGANLDKATKQSNKTTMQHHREIAGSSLHT